MEIKKSLVEKYATPYKLGRPVLAGSGMEGAFDSIAVDVPFVFYHRNRFYMTYVGFDGIGYQTALATSENLTDWSPQGVILGRKEGDSWDRIGAAGTWILKESNDLYDLPTLKKIDNRYWMVYHAYPSSGYEEGAAEMGLAWCEDEDLLEWHTLEHPVFSWKEGTDWEKGGLYKACLIEFEEKFYMFYNAKDLTSRGWIEQTGVAVSDNLLHWERHEHNPVLEVTAGRWDGTFVSDPCLFKDGELWLNFFFGYDGVHAQEGLACSFDLLHWEKHDTPILASGEKDSLDETHAHKASVIYYNGILYHFYCAVRPYRDGDVAGKERNQFRAITVATSKPLE
ncbi:hypothetical protein [Paenibacillus sp. MBLB4367]|uniref:hypothetical protein n=1 Tax=Paenibacillus sp. MBLB4367 TaxID=3384767 RepID=UPI0039083183